MLQNCIVTLQTSVKWQNNMLLTLHTLPGSRTVHESVYLCSQIKLIWPRILQRFAEVWTLILFCWNWLTLLECKGKMKLMVENRTSDPLDPSPDCDCHVSKSHNIDLQSVTHQEAFESTQVSLLLWQILWVIFDHDTSTVLVRLRGATVYTIHVFVWYWHRRAGIKE